MQGKEKRAERPFFYGWATAALSGTKEPVATAPARPAEAISLLDVYRAVEDQPYFMLHRTRPNDACYIGHAITPVLEQEFARVGLALEASLAQTSIAEMAGQVERRAGYPFVPCSPQYQADTQ
ncbi:Rrf2 family transcriptional regulator [Serratia marcescens]|uniref:Rrf2 family transcriptional regulator n=1 Tax=Serratia marcescens TaxID=615 RepID=UPI0027E471FD|nr:Rrf2 family transcriptional regulator [Serratia marcescens]MCS1371522.1 Rrf2 family transcriptional regulator [Serratia marcescens]